MMMKLSPEVIRGLEAELRRLEGEREQLDATMASIRQLLGQSSAPEEGLHEVEGDAPTGFREGIRAVLRKAGKPLTPKDVVEAIRENEYPGWDFGNLPTRVNNDLWKMKESGQLEKSSEGYSLAEGGTA